MKERGEEINPDDAIVMISREPPPPPPVGCFSTLEISHTPLSTDICEGF